jgi:hypothetical protein
MSKVQLSLTDEEMAILRAYGSQFGYSLPRTLRYLISKATEKFLREGTIPEFKLSEKNEKAGLEAIKEHRAGKTVAVENVDDFFNDL